MRLLLSTYDSRGAVEPLMGVAVRLRAFGAEVRVLRTVGLRGAAGRSELMTWTR